MTNTVYDIANARCCQDCVIIETNNDNSGMSEEQFERWLAGRANVGLRERGWEWSGVQCDSSGEYGEACDCDGENPEHPIEGWFSWSACEWCGDTDGGDRWNVAIMRRIA